MPFKWFTLKTNLASYVRNPSILELHGDRGSTKGNSELKSERGINFDLGAEIFYEFENDYLNRINFCTAFFKSKVENTIVPDYYAIRVIKYQNLDSSIYGIENSLSVDVLKYFKLAFNLTWQQTEVISDFGPFNGSQLPGIYEFSTFSKIEFKYEFFKAFCEYRFETDMYYDRANSNSLYADDKNEFNSGASVLLYDIRLTFEVKNILDIRYEDFPGYPAPGRTYNSAVKYNF